MSKDDGHKEVTVPGASVKGGKILDPKTGKALPAMPGQPIMEKPPKGYRMFTDDEESEAKRLVQTEQQIMEKLRRIDAEEKLGKMERREALTTLALLRSQSVKFNETLGLENPDDLKVLNGRTWVKKKAKDKTDKN